MEENTKNKIMPDYPVVQIGQAFYEEVLRIPDDAKSRRVYATGNSIWEYIPTTTLRLYWSNKKTWIHKLIEI